MDADYISKEERAEYLAYHSCADVLNNYENGISELKAFDFSPYRNGYTLICGGMVGFDKGILPFLNTWNEHRKLFLLSEVTAENRRHTREKAKMPFICTPHLLAKEMIITGMDIPVNDSMIQLSTEKKYVSEAVENVTGRHRNLGNGYAICWAYYAFEYIRYILEQLKPREVILWNEFYAFHHIIRGICMEKEIPLRYMEFGCLPGTFCIERQGQQGESWPAAAPGQFCSQKISFSDFVKTARILKYLRKSRLNRNIQPRNAVDVFQLKHYSPRRKTIVFFGHNEYESGMYPYSDSSQKFHSPVFKNSIEAVLFIKELADKNNWNLIYKPHPIMLSLGHIPEEHLHEIDIVRDVDINKLIDFADITISVISQSAYISLIRKKPVLMLGYTQLKEKECVYEAYDKERIEGELKIGISEGYTLHQRTAFVKHATQLLKYYLYDDLQHRNMEFGQKIENLWREDYRETG